MDSTDEERLLELHRSFIEANTHEDVPFLEAHAQENVTWYNLNKSNYMSRPEIIELWHMLYEARPDKTKDAKLTVSDHQLTIVGDAAWQTYLVQVDYDFGDVARVILEARSTEIWCRANGDWQLAHFHCSEHEAGNMGGK